MTALQHIATGTLTDAADPDTAILDLPDAMAAAVLYAVDRGLVAADRIVLTDAGLRVLNLIGGSR